MYDMRWNLERVLFWMSVVAALFLILTLLNFLWPFANPSQPTQRLYIGLTADVCRFLFAIVAYWLVHNKKQRAALAVVAIWVLSALLYGVAVVVFEPFSGFTIGILLGQLLFCVFLAYYSVPEAKSAGLLR